MVRLLSEVTAVHALSDAVDVYDDSTSRQAVPDWSHLGRPEIILDYPRMMPALSDAVDVYDDSISRQAVRPLLMTASELSVVKL